MGRKWLQEAEYEEILTQRLTQTEAYGMWSDKHPGSASCDSLIVKIKLPGETLKNIDLEIEESSIKLLSTQFYLDLPLSYETESDQAKAKWDRAFSTLRVELPLKKD